MANQLRDLKALEVSLVPKAANQKKFLILKSFDGEGKKDDEGGDNGMDKIMKILESKMENEKELEEITKELSEDAKEAMLGAMRLISEFKDELPEGMWDLMLEQINMPTAEQGEDGDNMNMSDDTITKESIEKMDLAPEVKAMMKALWKDKEDMSLKTTELEKMVQKAEDEKLTKEYVEVAKSFKNISVNPEEFGKILKDIALKSPESLEKIQEVLKGADEALKHAGIFKEYGSSGTASAGAWDKIEKLAEEIMKEEKISMAQAITKTMEQNPELYNEYLKERGEM